jgi:hypothetical protein
MAPYKAHFLFYLNASSFIQLNHVSLHNFLNISIIVTMLTERAAFSSASSSLSTSRQFTTPSRSSRP